MARFRWWRIVPIAIWSVASTSTSLAKEASAPPEYQTVRYEEDYSYLRDRSLATEPLDRIKYIPLDREGHSFLTLGGEVRERYEYFHNAFWGQGPQDRDGYLLQRYMLHANVRVVDWFRFFTEFKSGLVEDRNGGARPTDRDDFDLHQLFLDVFAHRGTNESFTLRLGRQELAYGSSRLVSVREGPTVRQSFDGAKLIAKLGAWRVDAFATRAVETKVGVFDDGPDPGRKLWGIYAVTPVSFLPGANVDLYYLGLERDEAEFDQGTACEIRHTVGNRLWGKRAGVDYNFEFAYQFGTFGPGDISAWTVASDTGYTLEEALFKPRFALKGDITSGDRDPDNADLQTFNPLFPRGSYFSETALIGPANHIDLHPSTELHITDSLRAVLDWDFFWRESTRDGIYGNAVNLIRSGLTSNARYVGNQVQFLTEWQANRHLVVTAAYAHFFAGEFLKESGPGEDVDYASVWATFRF
jgi:hypothetical protein